MDNKIYKLLVDNGAITSGHFILTSGLHSDRYIEKFRVLENPHSLGIICKEMAKIFKDEKIDIVVSAAIGGILLSSGVASELNVNGIFTERVNGKMELKRGFNIPQGYNILIVEDIVTTGGSIIEIISLLDKLDVNIAGICSLAHRGDFVDFGYIYKTLTRIDIDTWREENIPDWLNVIPITKPGSTGK